MKTKNIISVFISMLIIFGMYTPVNAGGGPLNQEINRVAQPLDVKVISGVNNSNGLGNKIQNKKEEKRAAVGKKVNKVDLKIDNFDKKFNGLDVSEQKMKYELLYSKIDPTLDKIDISDLQEEKKQAYRNIFEYIRAVLSEKIDSLN